MGQPLTKPATYDDLCRVPEHLVAEIIDGELITSPRPALPHARASSALQSLLHDAFDQGRSGPGGWWILFEPELHLRNDVLVPDIAGWRRERLPAIPDAAFMTLAPDWVCEMLSPSTEHIDRNRKMRIYTRERVRHVWLMDPIQRTVEVFARHARFLGCVGTFYGDDVPKVVPFDEIALDLPRIWPDLS